MPEYAMAYHVRTWNVSGFELQTSITYSNKQKNEKMTETEKATD